jgi:hypothetical protein
MVARTGATLTFATTPLGSFTGRALATRVSPIQKAIPIGPPISGLMGESTVAAANATIATATVTETTRRTVIDTGRVTLGERAGVYHAPLPALERRSSGESQGKEAYQGSKQGGEPLNEALHLATSTFRATSP